MCEKKEQGKTVIKGNTNFCKAARVIFTCFTIFSGWKVLEVDLSACPFLQCQSGGKETRCRLEPRSAELGYGKIIAQTAFIHMLCRADRIKVVQVTQGKINSGSQVPVGPGTRPSGAQSPPSVTGGAAWREPEQRHGVAGTWLLPMAELGVGLQAGPQLWLPLQVRWVRGMKMTQNWVEWLICQMLVTPFERTWTGWRNGLTGALWGSAQGSAKSWVERWGCWWDGQRTERAEEEWRNRTHNILLRKSTRLKIYGKGN